MNQILRWGVADYLNTGTTANPVWSLMGLGFTQVDEELNPIIDEKAYINDKAITKSITGYGASFPFTADVYSDEPTIKKLNDIADIQATGLAAVSEFIRTSFIVDDSGQPITTSVDARKFSVAIEVASRTGAGTEAFVISGNLHQRGDFVKGTFYLGTNEFFPEGEEPVIPNLTVTYETGTEIGEYNITVTPSKESGNKYFCKTNSVSIELPEYGVKLGTGYTEWDGESDIAVETTNYVAIVETTVSGIVKGAGQVQVTA